MTDTGTGPTDKQMVEMCDCTQDVCRAIRPTLEHLREHLLAMARWAHEHRQPTYRDLFDQAAHSLEGLRRIPDHVADIVEAVPGDIPDYSTEFDWLPGWNDN
jgi:hypothetical protein